MKKIALIIIGFLITTQCYAVTWTKDWQSSDDGKVLSGSDIQSLQNDVSTQSVSEADDNTFTGSLTFQGSTILSGENTFSGATTISCHTHLMTRPAGTYDIIHVGSFSKNLASSGTQAVTGVGFKPGAVTLLACVSGSTAASWGMDNSVTRGSSIDFKQLAGADNYGTTDSQPIFLLTAGGPAYAVGVLSSLDTDGFTITWTAVNAPVGTAVVYYMAFKN